MLKLSKSKVKRTMLTQHRVGMMQYAHTNVRMSLQVTRRIQECDLVLMSLFFFQWAFWNAFSWSVIVVVSPYTPLICWMDVGFKQSSLKCTRGTSTELENRPWSDGLQQWRTGRALRPLGYVHNPPSQGHFLRSNTQTDPSEALAPTLSPVAFQQTSKMPPVPR